MRLKGQTIVVTGGAGFLGSHLCEKLVAEGAKVRVLDTFSSGREDNLSTVRDRVEMVNCSVACESCVGKAVEGAGAVVHLAFPMDLRRRCIETRAVTEILGGLMNLVKACLEQRALLVYVSSIAVYGNGRSVPIDEDHPLEPVLIHGAVKAAGETFCRTLAVSEGLRAVVLRVADIYGPRNSRVSVPIKFLLQAARGEPITVFGDGSDSRTYTYVSDFTEAVVLSLVRSGAAGGVFNIGGDECVSMVDLARAVQRVTGGRVPVIFQDGPAAGRRLIISSQKAKDLLGFKPACDIGKGLSLTYRWLVDHAHYYPDS